MAEIASIETRREAEGVDGVATFWAQQLELTHTDHKDFIDEGRKVVKRYKGDKESSVRSRQQRFNILFSNTETLKAALFARMAKPDIRRRFADRDPIGKQVAEIVERATIYCQDTYDSEKAVERAIEDYLLPGRGIVRVCYEAETEQGSDGKDYVAKQELYEQYVNWEDYRHEPSKTWDKVTWEAFRHRMSRDDLKTNRFEKWELIPLNWSPAPESEKVPDSFKRAEVWEIFDKTKRQRVWIVPGFKTVCRTDADPYGLEDFFPNAEPLQAVTANDTFIPRPEFSVYRDQADGLDEIEARIDRLTRALRRRGVYDATFKELAKLSKAADNEFIPVKNYAELSTKGGLAAAFQAEDLKVIAEVLGELHQQRDLRVQTIYEVVGIADIMRGATDPRETLGAQKIKAQFGGNRLKKRQDKVQKWIRDTLRIKAELIAEHFEPQKLAEMTGFKLLTAQDLAMIPPGPDGQPQPPPTEGVITPDMVKVLRSDKLRSYRIDVETDSTVFEDAEAEKQAVTEMLKAASEFVIAWVPVIQAQPAMLDMAFEMLAFALRRFKTGRSLEEVIEQTKLKLTQAAQQPKPPTPEELKAQAEIQAKKEEAAIKQQESQAKLAAQKQEGNQKIALAQQAHDQEMAREAQKHAAEMAMLREKSNQQAMDHDNEMARTAQKHDADMQHSAEDHQMKAEAQELKNEEAPAGDASESKPRKSALGPNRVDALVGVMAEMQKMMAHHAKPKRIVRDEKTGRAVGIEAIN